MEEEQIKYYKDSIKTDLQIINRELCDKLANQDFNDCRYSSLLYALNKVQNLWYTFSDFVADVRNERENDTTD